LSQKKIGNAILPAHIRPTKVTKRKFVMDKVEDSDYILKPREEEAVESLLDNEPSYQPNTYGAKIKTTS
jgi:hypothetical protein